MVQPLIAIIGANRIEPAIAEVVEALGRGLVDAGFRIICGGLGGVMAAVACGARASAAWTGAEVIGLLPGWIPDEQPNPWIDIALPTGMGTQRNNLIARVADAAIAIAGGAGTLGEIALVWHEGRPLGCLDDTGGWAERLAGERLDDRRERPIARLSSVEDALAWLDELFPRGVWPWRGPTRWWHEQVPRLARAVSRDVEPRLVDLAERVREWNHQHDQRRSALVTVDDVDAATELIATFTELPELQPVVFVAASELERRESVGIASRRLQHAGWLLGARGPDGDLDSSRLLAARRSLIERGGTPWIAWPEGRCSDERAALARACGFALQFGCEREGEGEGESGLILRTTWT